LEWHRDPSPGRAQKSLTGAVKRNGPPRHRSGLGCFSCVNKRHSNLPEEQFVLTLQSGYSTMTSNYRYHSRSLWWVLRAVVRDSQTRFPHPIPPARLCEIQYLSQIWNKGRTVLKPFPDYLRERKILQSRNSRDGRLASCQIRPAVVEEGNGT
jgi:hypothetical protein